MTTEITTHDEIVAVLRQRMRVGAGLTVPYARKWAIGGCEPSHSLWTFPHDEIATMAAGLLQLNASIVATDRTVRISHSGIVVWVAANGESTRAEGPSEFLIRQWAEGHAMYVGNSAQVVLEIIKRLSAPPPRPGTADQIIQIGFPGIHDNELTYVGSWQWYVHGEARDDEWVRRAAHSTLSAIQAKRDNAR
ncbi:hypothetical protein ACNO8X_23815 [Mycobacterium sp. PDNC021]|uniref:hypothetical protein n=1 Tax=Mycobacterium sp. PDNC021 TaxID=3391399 RepID=UPI003AB09ACD